MQVQYERTEFEGESDVTQDTILWWLESNLKSGGIESQIAKVRDLLAIVAEQWLESHPERIGDVAEAIECDGYNHTITPEES